jgi:hypothetical protein
MLNKYYGLSDDSIMYRIAMRKLFVYIYLYTILKSLLVVLHPKYKSAYFIKAGWPAAWIKTAEDLLRAQWRDHYKPSSTGSNVRSLVRNGCILQSVESTNWSVRLHQARTTISQSSTRTILLRQVMQLMSG